MKMHRFRMSECGIQVSLFWFLRYDSIHIYSLKNMFIIQVEIYHEMANQL